MSTNSIIYDDKLYENYFEIVNKDKTKIKLIIRSDSALIQFNNDSKKIENESLNKYDEITIISDYEFLSLELDTEELKKIIFTFYEKIYDKIDIKKIDENNKKLNLIIQNTYINIEKNITQISNGKTLYLNKLEITDELYSFSSIFNILFPNLKVNELILKKFKFNSKEHLSNFCKFINKVECKKLTLDDIFIELIIKKNEDDEDYKDLDIYFTYEDDVLTLDNTYSSINSLTLRDCPLFAISGDMFREGDFGIINKNIDIDDNSLLNPSIITKFKIKEGQFDLCFDLDSFKIKLEDEDNNYDYIDYLSYLFKIIISFESEEQKIQINEEENIGEIDGKYIHKMKFKNFDITKLEYITDDDITFIDEKNQVSGTEEEKERKVRWEKFENELENFKFTKLSNVKELVFDNCSNFFIKWILYFVKGKNKINEIKEKQKDKYDFDLLKLKKCGKDYVDLSNILTLKINKLILFDNPLIIGDKFLKFDNLNHIQDDLGTIDNLTIKINSLDSYGKEYNLNTYKTYQILVELIKNKNFNKNITFEFNALSCIMTYLAYEEFLENPGFYSGDLEEIKTDEDEETARDREKTFLDKIKKKNYEEASKVKHINYKNIEIPKQLPQQIFFFSKKYRDYIYYKAFNLEKLENSKITLKNMTIKKESENYENQIYLLKKNDLFKSKNSYSSNRELKKIDFGSDGFYINRDYKFFLSENKIELVELVNVSFSNYKDPILKDLEKDSIINLITISQYEEKNMANNNYKIYFPNYKIDAKTFNYILYKNYLFEDLGMMFKYFLYKIDEQYDTPKTVSSDSIEKKSLLSNYFTQFLKIFECFKKKKNKENTIIVLNSIKELKEMYCTFCILEILLIEENWIKEELKDNRPKNPREADKITIRLPDKKLIKKEIGDYFLKEKNEKDEDEYSELNYFYTSTKEEEMIKNKKIKINDDYEFNIELNADIY